MSPAFSGCPSDCSVSRCNCWIAAFFVLGEVRAQADPFRFTVQGRCGCLCYQGADGASGAVFQVQRQAEQGAGDDIFLAWLGVGRERAVKAPWVLRSGQAVQGREYPLE